MSDNIINSNISPLEMSKLNQEDAKKIDASLGIIMNDISGMIMGVNGLVEDVKTELSSLKTRIINFDLSDDFDTLEKRYDDYVKDAVNFAGYYELSILRVIAIFDKQNSLDGSLTVDNNFLRYLPFLGTTLFTITNYFKSTIGKELLDGTVIRDYLKGTTQISLDITENIMDKDFNESLGNLFYNIIENEFSGWNMFVTSGLAATGLIAVESLYEFVHNNDPKHMNKVFIEATGDGVKLLIGNIVAENVATKAATFVGAKIAGLTGSKIVGAAAGGIAGVGIVVVSEIALNFVIDPIVDELTGNVLINGTSILKNGGRLYSEHVQSFIPSLFEKTSCDINETVKYSGMSISKNYLRSLIQTDPIGTISRLDNRSFHVGTLEEYLKALNEIPTDCDDYELRIKKVTDYWQTVEPNYDSKYSRDGSTSFYQPSTIQQILELGFDPYSYVKK